MQSLDSELSAAQKRHLELDKIIKHLFEQSVSGIVTDIRFQKLNTDYEAEQSGLEKRIGEIRSELDALQQNKHDSTV